jgi:hypothetical protein
MALFIKTISLNRTIVSFVSFRHLGFHRFASTSLSKSPNTQTATVEELEEKQLKAPNPFEEDEDVDWEDDAPHRGHELSSMALMRLQKRKLVLDYMRKVEFVLPRLIGILISSPV